MLARRHDNRAPAPAGRIRAVGTTPDSRRNDRAEGRRLCRRARSTAELALKALLSERSDELLHPLVFGLERVLAEHRALGLIVELQVHPVDGEVPPALLGLLDELAPQLGARRLR